MQEHFKKLNLVLEVLFHRFASRLYCCQYVLKYPRGVRALIFQVSKFEASFRVSLFLPCHLQGPEKMVL